MEVQTVQLTRTTDQLLRAQTNISLPHEQLADFCRRWKVTELALFGSVLRDDFRPDSDVDVLVTFAEENQVWAYLRYMREAACLKMHGWKATGGIKC